MTLIYGWMGVPKWTAKTLEYIESRDKDIHSFQTIGAVDLTLNGKRLCTNFRSMPLKGKTEGQHILPESFLLTHSTHSFVSVTFNDMDGTVELSGYWNEFMIRVIIDSDEFESGMAYAIKREHIHRKSHGHPHTSPPNLEPPRQYEVKEGDNSVAAGETIYVNRHNNEFVPRTGASGNMFIKKYEEKDGKIKFAFAFYGTAEGEYLGLDESPRGSLEPNYKMIAAGFGTVIQDDRHLIFSFRYKNKDYIFRYIVPGKKPDVGRAYFVSTDDRTSEAILKEAPDDVMAASGGNLAESPVFIIDYKGNKRTSSSSNEVAEPYEPPKKKEVRYDSIEDFANAMKPKTHIKERPEPIRPEEGTIDVNVLYFKIVQKLQELRTEFPISYVQEGRVLLVNIEHADGVIKFRIKCNKTMASVQYMDEDAKWAEVKRFVAPEHGKAGGRLVRLVSDNARIISKAD